VDRLRDAQLTKTPEIFDAFFTDIYIDNLRMNKNESSDFPNYLRKDTHQCCIGGPDGPDNSRDEPKRPKAKDARKSEEELAVEETEHKGCLKGKGFFNFIQHEKLN